MTAHRALVLGAMCLGVIACAHRGNLPVFTEGNLETPEPDGMICGSTAPDVAQLDVLVGDGFSGGFPGAAVYVFGTNSANKVEPPSPLALYTNSLGHALVRVEGGHYNILVSLGGFIPELRVFQLKSGCSGKVEILLRVAENERVRALNRQSKQ